MQPEHVSSDISSLKNDKPGEEQEEEQVVVVVQGQSRRGTKNKKMTSKTIYPSWIALSYLPRPLTPSLLLLLLTQWSYQRCTMSKSGARCSMDPHHCQAPRSPRSR